MRATLSVRSGRTASPRMRHSDTALHCSHGSQWVHARAVASGVNAVHARAGHAVHLNMAARVCSTPAAPGPKSSVFGIGPATQAVAPETYDHPMVTIAGAILSTQQQPHGNVHHSRTPRRSKTSSSTRASLRPHWKLLRRAEDTQGHSSNPDCCTSANPGTGHT